MNFFNTSKLALVIFLLGLGLASGQSTSEERRSMVQQWIETEHLISQEKAEWKENKAVSEQLLDLHEKELKKLDEELATMGGSIEGVDEYQQELEAKMESYRKEQQQMKAKLQRLSQKVVSLVATMPESRVLSLGEDVEILKKADQHSARELLLATINVLQSNGHFHSSITVIEEFLQLGKEKVRARVMYFGMSRAFFQVGDRGGIGVIENGVWKWGWKEGIGAKVAKAIDIYEKKSRAELITLPLQMKEVAP